MSLRHMGGGVARGLDRAMQAHMARGGMRPRDGALHHGDEKPGWQVHSLVETCRPGIVVSSRPYGDGHIVWDKVCEGSDGRGPVTAWSCGQALGSQAAHSTACHQS